MNREDATMPVFDFLKDNAAERNRQLVELPVAKIRPNPYQPRTAFDEESIAELAQSIRQVGLLQPLLVRRVGDDYELVAGERRLRAVTSLGMTHVSCIVQQEVMDETSAVMALIENLQREDLHFLEEAQCYSSLLETYGLTQEQLAERLGKSQSSIANKLRLLKLSDEVKTAMTDARLSERHARALLKLGDDESRLDMVHKIAERGLSVKETEQLVEKTL
ncbi:MAG TPA: ParB/RepB/Spo0J family partition protein, partial [Clostridia bacterium]|nr:ParB/RepB/Spo0J family partition protein [Clostridia bacterium]